MSGGAADGLPPTDGRLPVLPNERIFKTKRSFFASCVVFGAAVWVFMVGAGLSALGDVRFVAPGYVLGTVIGLVPVLVSNGLPSFRYGIDPIDATKATFGVRGSVIPLLGLLYVALAWACVVTAFIAQGGATLATAALHHDAGEKVHLALVAAVAGCAWAMVKLGPQFMERVNNVVGPSLIVLSAVLLILLAQRIGWQNLWVDHIPVTGRLFPNRALATVSAIEIGIGTSLGAWPFMGALTRFLRYRSDMVTPTMMGTGVLGAGFGAAVSAVVANALPSPDPVAWFLDLGGPWLGSLVAGSVLLGNIAVVGLFIYFAAVAMQQVSWIRRLQWDLVVAGLVLVVGAAAVNAKVVLSLVLTIAAYQGMLFVGIAAVATVNYLFIEKQRIDLDALFDETGRGRYARSGGVDWIACFAATAGAVIYRIFYDPLTLKPGIGFFPLGASLPSFCLTMALFVVLRLVFRRGLSSLDR